MNSIHYYNNFKIYYFGIIYRIGWGGGDPHITSLDGLSYTFNGLGEYRMVEIGKYQFTMQGRTGRVESGSTKATEFVAFAFAVNDEKVEVQV